MPQDPIDRSYSTVSNTTQGDESRFETPLASPGALSSDNEEPREFHPSTNNSPSRPVSRSGSLSTISYQENRPDDSNGSSANSSSQMDEFMNQHTQEEVRDLARTISRQSLVKGHPKDYDPEKGGIAAENLSLSRTLSHFRDQVANDQDRCKGINPIGADEEELDPNSPNFSSVEWAKNMYRIYQGDPDRYKPREMGFLYKNLSVYGYGTDADYQATVGNTPLKWASMAWEIGTGFRNRKRVDILYSMEGAIRPGEMVLVLGRPGAGCSTYLKTVSQNTYGFHVSPDSDLNYSGLTAKDITKHFRGDVVYSAESETHFPHLTVGQTLLLAAKMRTPSNRIEGVSRLEYATHMRDVIMATFGLSHTMNTKVGNDFVRGVSGGERKRVSIAEIALSGAPLQCWDNSTRGLDSATALEFVRTLKASARIFGNTSLIAVYQSSEEMYELFDKVTLLYEGHQIFFGTIEDAKEYFLDMGYVYKPRQPTPDFLTSLTMPNERIAKKGFEHKVPRTPEEFEARWRESKYYAKLQEEIAEFEEEYAIHGENYDQFKESHNAQQQKRIPHRSPFLVDFKTQVWYLIQRGYQRMLGDFSMQFTTLFGNSSMSLILASMFYNLPSDTESFYRRSAVLFFAILFNAFSSLLEIFSLYEARPIVDKHRQFALYHPAADAMASILTELPLKILVCLVFNLILYFMVNLRREPGNFFLYLLFSFTATISMSHLFRTMGSITKSIQEAMVPATILLLALVIYTGFVIPTNYMHGWSRWINYINPVGYAFEALMANEFHDRLFDCSAYIPAGPGYDRSQLPPDSWICSGTAGAVPGQTTVQGTDYIQASYQYSFSHVWRNWGIILGFVAFFLFTYLLGVWLNPGLRTKGEILVFPRSVLSRLKKEHKIATSVDGDIEAEGSNGSSPAGSMIKDDSGGTLGSEQSSLKGVVETSNEIFYWQNVCYDIKIKKEDRRILDNVDGWVKPGTLTALMGASGAGKTTLLDTLANRVTMGVVTGDMFVNAIPRDASFQRSTGYAQQQDLHLETTTVREALIFSALLRQPREVPREEKIAYVDNVLKVLEMEAYADAVVGVPGEGLNVEQRKRLTIGVELAAKPKLLLFLDEPTSGLDSQTAWAICQLMKKLSKAGQAILCTIHQPSAMLLQEFDRLLFLAKGGRTVYFGDIGENSKTLTDYFERQGADPCPPEANPAEWMLHVIGAAPGSKANRDYVQAWNESPEKQAVKDEIANLIQQFGASLENSSDDKLASREFAMPLFYQIALVTKRVIEQYWRTPSYIYSKLVLATFSGLFNGFSFFKADNTLQGLQNLMFSIFMFFMVFNSSIEQLIPFWVKQRDLYEARERPSKMFSWKAFVTAQIIAELPWQLVAATISFFCWYYPIGFYNNASLTDATTHRGGLMYFFVLLFFFYISTMGQMCIAGMELADTASNVGSLLFTLCLLFCGVLVTKEAMPGFWVFMYRVSPFTYLVAGMLATGVANAPVVCSDTELVRISPPSGISCLQYLGPYANATGGRINDPSSTTMCSYCPVTESNTYLASIDIYYSDVWRNLGIFLCYPFIHIIAIYFLYWLARVPKKNDRVKH